MATGAMSMFWKPLLWTLNRSCVTRDGAGSTASTRPLGPTALAACSEKVAAVGPDVHEGDARREIERDETDLLLPALGADEAPFDQVTGVPAAELEAAHFDVVDGAEAIEQPVEWLAHGAASKAQPHRPNAEGGNSPRAVEALRDGRLRGAHRRRSQSSYSSRSTSSSLVRARAVTSPIPAT